MLINILQCNVLLSEAEAHQCKWAATVNWKGGSGNNIEIDLFQENRNCEMKNSSSQWEPIRRKRPLGEQQGIRRSIKSCWSFWGSSKDASIVNTHPQVATTDEVLISRDLRALRPFQKEDGRHFESFVDIHHDPTHSLDQAKLKEWIERHKNNILLHYPLSDESE